MVYAAIHLLLLAVVNIQLLFYVTIGTVVNTDSPDLNQLV